MSQTKTRTKGWKPPKVGVCTWEKIGADISDPSLASTLDAITWCSPAPQSLDSAFGCGWAGNSPRPYDEAPQSSPSTLSAWYRISGYVHPSAHLRKQHHVRNGRQHPGTRTPVVTSTQGFRSWVAQGCSTGMGWGNITVLRLLYANLSGPRPLAALPTPPGGGRVGGKGGGGRGAPAAPKPSSPAKEPGTSPAPCARRPQEP